jgi:proline racemase
MRDDVRSLAPRTLAAIDTHTAGAPTRIITGGLPQLRGATVVERMAYFQSSLDHLRSLLVLEPRGHNAMYVAVPTPPNSPSADAGIFFANAGGYLPICIHGLIGFTWAGLETGFLSRQTAAGASVHTVDLPGDSVLITAKYLEERLDSIAVRAPESFVHTPSLVVRAGDEPALECSIGFCGVFMALVDVEQLTRSGGSGQPFISRARAPHLATLGAELLRTLNQRDSVRHPARPENERVKLALFYERVSSHLILDLVTDDRGRLDRSPCGAGIGALLTLLHSQGQHAGEEEIRVMTCLGTQLQGRVVSTTRSATHSATVTEIRGSASITGFHQFVLNPGDPLPEGFSPP